MAVRQGAITHFEYGLVAFQGQALAESGVSPESAPKQRELLIGALSRAEPNTARFQSEGPGQRYFFLQESSGVAFACVAHSSVSQANGFEFLTNLQSRWTRVSGPGATSANPRFGETEIATQLRSYNSAQYDKISTIRDNLAESQLQTTKNLAKALERGEAIDVMSEKAITMRDSAQTFHREATKLKNQMCWQRYMWQLLGVAIGIAAIAIIVIVLVV
jgi:vesicle-associated membrane protein 7